MTVEELEQQWMALRYAIDQIDLAWSFNPEGFTGELYEEKRREMQRHREVLITLYDDVLKKKYELERNK